MKEKEEDCDHGDITMSQLTELHRSKQSHGDEGQKFKSG